jgi:hypothetical protein
MLNLKSFIFSIQNAKLIPGGTLQVRNSYANAFDRKSTNLNKKEIKLKDDTFLEIKLNL